MPNYLVKEIFSFNENVENSLSGTRKSTDVVAVRIITIIIILLLLLLLLLYVGI